MLKFLLSLVSNSKLTRDLKCSITFTFDSISIQDMQTRRVIDTGHESKGSYELVVTPLRSVFLEKSSPLRIHSHSRHTGLKSLYKMVPFLSGLSNLKCQSY